MRAGRCSWQRPRSRHISSKRSILCSQPACENGVATSAVLLLLLLLSLQGLRLLLLRLLRGMNNRQTAIVPPILAGSLGDCHLGRLTPDRSKIKRLLLLLSL